MFDYRRVGGLLALSLSLSACMVGPDFRSPKPPVPQSYTQSPLPSKTVGVASTGKAGRAQHFVNTQNLPGEWWRLFHSPQLNTLMRMGIANSPNLAAALASLRQAQETLNAQIGSTLLPAFNAVGNAERQKLSSSNFDDSGVQTNIFNLFNATVTVSYTFDIFGGARRAIEAARAQVDYKQYQLIAAYLTLTADIATTAITIASLEAQAAATLDLIRIQNDQLNILEKQFNLGAISRTDVLTQETLVEQTRATLPPIEKSLSQSRHALSVLVGLMPNRPLPVTSLAHLVLPRRLPVSLPSSLVRQRPDIQASEALLHVASAQIGVATANLFPQFTMTGNYGWISNFLSNLISPNNTTWDILGTITQPVFRGGSLFAQRRAAKDAFDQAFAQYRQTLLVAFRNVADVLRALETDARSLRAQKRAEIAAYKTLVLSQQQYRLGGTNYLILLNAQQQYQQTRINRIRAEATRYTDTAALFQALGGGWWNTTMLPCVKDKKNQTKNALCIGMAPEIV